MRPINTETVGPAEKVRDGVPSISGKGRTAVGGSNVRRPAMRNSIDEPKNKLYGHYDNMTSDQHEMDHRDL
jgi:hypothetical protein